MVALGAFWSACRITVFVVVIAILLRLVTMLRMKRSMIFASIVFGYNRLWSTTLSDGGSSSDKDNWTCFAGQGALLQNQCYATFRLASYYQQMASDDSLCLPHLCRWRLQKLGRRQPQNAYACIWRKFPMRHTQND